MFHVEHRGHYVRASFEASRVQHLGLLGAAILHLLHNNFGVPGLQSFPAGVYWKTLTVNPDGSPKFILLDPVITFKIFAADMALEASNFSVAEQHRSQMLLSSDPLNYDYTSGWIPIFGE